MSLPAHRYRFIQPLMLLLAACFFLLTPHTVHADPMVVFYRTLDNVEPIEIRKLQTKPTTLAGMNKKGLFSFRIGETALNISYTPDKCPQLEPSTATILALRETPPLSGISLTVSFSF